MKDIKKLSEFLITEIETSPIRGGCAIGDWINKKWDALEEWAENALDTIHGH